MIRSGLWPRLQHLPRDARQRVVAGVFGSKGRCRRRRRESCEGGAPPCSNRRRVTSRRRRRRSCWRRRWSLRRAWPRRLAARTRLQRCRRTRRERGSAHQLQRRRCGGRDSARGHRLVECAGLGPRGQRSGWARASQVVGDVRGHVGELKGARGLRQPRLCAVATGSEQARGGVGAGRVRRGVRARGGTPRGNASSDGELARQSAGGGSGGRSSGAACARCCVRRCWCGRRLTLSPRRKQGAARRRWARSGGGQMAWPNRHRRRRRRLQWPCWRHWRKGWRRLWLRLPLQRGRCSDLSKLGGWRHRPSGLLLCCTLTFGSRGTDRNRDRAACAWLVRRAIVGGPALLVRRCREARGIGVTGTVEATGLFGPSVCGSHRDGDH
mmetsp:Transcript_15471/g.48356  ORF Transcript_15471/g.48356 Transcript_15471/m.48356 type:complete len:382 (-) Transcript_15471:1156-2301(-)